MLRKDSWKGKKLRRKRLKNHKFSNHLYSKSQSIIKMHFYACYLFILALTFTVEQMTSCIKKKKMLVIYLNLQVSLSEYTAQQRIWIRITRGTDWLSKVTIFRYISRSEARGWESAALALTHESQCLKYTFLRIQKHWTS